LNAFLSAGKVIRDQFVDQLCDALPVRTLSRECGKPANWNLGIADGDRAFATLEKGVVVASIADSNDLVERKAKHPQCMVQSGSFIDTSRDHHNGPPVERDCQFQPCILDCLQNGCVVRYPSRYNHSARIVWDAHTSQPLGKLRGHGIVKEGFRSRPWGIDYSTIFSYSVIEYIDAATDHEEILQPSASDQDYPTTGHAQSLNRRDRNL